MVSNAITTNTTITTATTATLVEAWLAGKSPRTIRAYSMDLAAFARFVGAETTTEAIHLLLGRGPVEGALVARRWVGAMTGAGLAPATINRRLAAIRSISALARLATGWALEVPSIPAARYRDTRGPGRGAVHRLLAAAAGQRDRLKAARDVVLIRLLHDIALRRAEVASLDLDSIDLAGAAVRVVGKGRREAEVVTIPAPTLEAIRAWIHLRGAAPGPLLHNLDRRTRGGRITGNGIHRILDRLGESIGVRVRPHGLRHAAITNALDATSGDVRSVQRFSRHRDLKTLLVYDDARRDLGGEVASMVALGTMQPMEEVA
jgi:integrase/recombinase XerC